MSGGEGRGVLLMTYGSPASLEREELRAYLARVRGGREPDTELVDEFTRRYGVIGGSPLVEITRSQAAALAESLGWPVEVGMRFSAPSIADGIRSLAERGVDRIAAIILSPQFSPLLMDGYAKAIDEARAKLGDRAPRVEVAGAWHDEPAFIDALADRVREALALLPPTARETVAVLMTAHSLPRRVAEQEPAYLGQLRDTAEAVATRAGVAADRWQFCWQSAGHEPGEWMKPDFADLMPELAAAGRHSVLVAPVQFLADHLEILYDVDIGAREQAERYGLTFRRIESLNTDSRLTDAMAAVARRTLNHARTMDRKSPPRVELLWFADCPNHEAARQSVRAILSEVAPEAEFADLDASDPTVAALLLFPGSPTVRVNGVDVEPGFADPGDYAPRCRLYRVDGRLARTPDPRWIRNAVVVAAG